MQIALVLALLAGADALKVTPVKPARAPVSNALALRGGASLGPLTPEILTKVQVALGVLYAAEMFGVSPITPDPVAKYYPSGSASTGAALQWFGLALLWFNGFLYYCTSSLGVSAVEIQKSAAVAWAGALLLYTSQVNKGAVKPSEAPYLQGTMTALSAYAGFVE